MAYDLKYWYTMFCKIHFGFTIMTFYNFRFTVENKNTEDTPQSSIEVLFGAATLYFVHHPKGNYFQVHHRVKKYRWAILNDLPILGHYAKCEIEF